MDIIYYVLIYKKLIKIFYKIFFFIKIIIKKNDNFVFRKKHENQKEIYSDEYLVNFLKSNMNNLIH